MNYLKTNPAVIKQHFLLMDKPTFLREIDNFKDFLYSDSALIVSETKRLSYLLLLTDLRIFYKKKGFCKI